jgi:hypothetical protein
MGENKNLTNCKVCGKEIAKGVKKCPHCGADQRNWFMKHKILSGIIVIVVIAAINSAVGRNKNAPNPTAPNTPGATSTPAPVINVTAPDLAKAYEDNEVNADKNYKNKTVLISGKVSDIGVVLDQTYVVLSAEKEFAVTQVQCFFQDKPEIDKVATLKKGDNVKIQGVVEGKSMNVSVRKCVLK